MHCVLGSGAGVAADAGADPVVAPEVMADLVRWIGAATEYDVSATLAALPEVSFCIHGETIDYAGERVTVEEDVLAAFDDSARRIFLVRPWSAEDPRDVSRLLHELIHDVQLANRYWECPQAPEWEAYKLQDKWLAERGIASGFDWLEIYFLARCPRDIHP